MNWKISYTSDILKRDALAALTVAAISLPQAMAYALLAGVDPRYGLYSAIVVTFIASVFGSSSHLVNGPTAAISLVVFTALAHFDPDQRAEAAQAMLLLAVMVGSIQILIAVFRLGDLTRYISESVILGFMTAASIQLGIGQISNALGVRNIGTGYQHLLYRLWLTLTEGDPINLKAVAIAAVTLVLALYLRRVVRRHKLPQFDMIASLVLVAFGAFLLGWTVPGADGKAALRVAGAVPNSLPSPSIPDINLNWIPELLSDAFAIAFLGLLEALAIAKSIANQTKQQLDYNRQILAEGILRDELQRFLSEELRLSLSMEKTKVTHLNEGFVFLGFQIKRGPAMNGGMTTRVLIPSKAIKKHLDVLKAAFSPSTHEDSSGTKAGRYWRDESGTTLGTKAGRYWGRKRDDIGDESGTILGTKAGRYWGRKRDDIGKLGGPADV